jgi:hypothetical protein
MLSKGNGAEEVEKPLRTPLQQEENGITAAVVG